MTLKFSSVLLFALLIFFILTYRLSSGSTPYWLFGLIFLGLLVYIFADLSLVKLKEKIIGRVKYFTLWFLIFASIGAGMYSSIVVRRESSPIYGVHDIVVQQEIAARRLIHGVNPYSGNYLGTVLEKWNYSDTEINPALYHFVMQPFYLIFTVPFYLFSAHIFPGFFDGRIPLFLLFITLLIFAGRLISDQEKKLQFITLLAFNPATLGYFIEGRADIFMFAFMFGGFYFLHKGKNFISGVLIALAFAVKQSAWPLFPFYLVYLYVVKNKNIKKTAISLLPFTFTFGFITLPFILWNSDGFITSTISYLSGNAEHSYPIAGYGLGSLLKDIGIIKNQYSYYPFWIWQLILGFPLMVWLIKWQIKNNSVKNLIIVYALFTFVFWYFSRYFNNSHLGYISMVLITAYFWPEKEDLKN